MRAGALHTREIEVRQLVTKPPPRFTEATLTKGVNFGHLVPAHAAETLDPHAFLPELLRATPGAAGVYLHKGTLAKAALDRWTRALADHGVPCLQSASWEPLDTPISEA